VLVIDFAEEGDLSKRLLGGVDNASKKADELFGGVFRLLSQVREKADAGLLSRWLFSQEVDIAQHAIRVADHNPNVPENLFLMSSGAWPDAQQMEPEAQRQLSAKI